MNVMTGAGRKTTHRRGIPHRFKHHANHPHDPWDVVVDVFLNAVEPGKKPHFDIQTCLPVKSPSSDRQPPEIQFENSGRPGFSIRFRLFDNTNGGNGSGYRFPLRAADGLWSQVGNDCPVGPAYEVFPEEKLDVEEKGMTLLAFNPNPSPAQGQFQYTLNVSVGGNKPFTALDPGGNNMNGGWDWN